MASYHPHDREHSRRVLAGDDLDEWDPRYFDSHGNFRDSSTQIVPRAREDSGLSAEGLRRDYLVTTERDVRRARSAEPGYVQQDFEYHRSYGHPHPEPSRHDRQYEHRVRRTDRYYEDEVRSQVRTEVRTERTERRQKHPSGLTTQDKIIAAVAGAALLAGGKEMYDRHEAKEDGTPVHRNPLASAALAGFGALAAYQGAEFYSDRQAKKDRRAKHILHRGQTNECDYSSSSDDDDDHDHHYHPGYGSREKKGRKNFLESALAATGLGAAVKSLAAGGDDRRSDTRSRGGSPTPSRASSGRDGRGHSKVQQAAIASLLAGATEAFRVAKEPGGWRGEKTKRILTAAAGAATVDAAHGADHGKMGLAESVIGGLVGNRLINGSRNDIEEDRMTGRSRSRSRARSRAGGGGGGGGAASGSAVSSLAALATAGLGALGAKKALDRSRSRSRGRYDSRSPSGDRRQERSRSRSVVDKARDGLARLGLGGQGSVASGEHQRRQRRDRQGSFDAGSQASRRSQRQLDSYDDYGHRHGERNRSRDRHSGGRRSGYGSDSSDLGDSDDDKMRKRDRRRH